MFCNKCGAKLPDGARFCQNCGSPVKHNADRAEKTEIQDQKVRHLPSPKKALAICFGVVVILAALILALQPKEKAKDAQPKSGGSVAVLPAVLRQDPVTPETPQTDESGARLNETVDAVLSIVESTKGFVEPDGYYQPLANLTDMDGNGVYELLTLYRVNEDGRFRVDYSVWRIEGESYDVLRNATLYDEAGGNSGYIIPAADMGGNPYLLTVSRNPQGDRFNDTYIYLPYNGEQTVLSDAWVYMEAHGTYGQEDEGEYILGDKRVDKADFDSRQADFTCYWSELNLNKGPGSAGGSMSFEQMRETDLSTLIFFSP